ncbi:glycerophosphodiester phosphodiesterase [Candidatus Saccharibacteria bacterium]|nr:glycerophosphodiester phosphodiesterase [Candidatus Saccharibacteria bacterium]
MKLTQTGAAIIAHRGASADAPENTLASFELAIVQGAEWIEFDVRRSLDGILFIHHDPNRGSAVLAKLTFEQIKDLPGGETIPTFEQLLRAVQGRVKLDIELKEAGFEAEVVATARKFFMYDEIIVTSFLDDVLAKIKAIDSNIRTGLLVGRQLNHQDPLRQLPDLFPGARVRRIGAHFVASHYLFGDVLYRWLLRRSGIPVVMWTIDNPSLIRRYLRDPNVVAIITNRPAVALKQKAEFDRRKAIS